MQERASASSPRTSSSLSGARCWESFSRRFTLSMRSPTDTPCAISIEKSESSGRKFQKMTSNFDNHNNV